MGDRSNIKISDKYSGNTYLYSHYDGADILDSAVHGLMTDRATDSQYLPRVIFAHMIRRDVEGTTGYGISGKIGDNSYPILTIDPSNGKVWFEDDNSKALSQKVSIAQFLAFHSEHGNNITQLIERLGAAK